MPKNVQRISIVEMSQNKDCKAVITDLLILRQTVFNSDRILFSFLLLAFMLTHAIDIVLFPDKKVIKQPKC